MRVANSFYDDRGDVVRVGRELGRGGEGSVVEVAGLPNMVAKIYHQPLDEKKSQKLLTMVRGTDDQLLKIAAWPVRTLHQTQSGPVNGFVMPKVTSFHELHVLHGPKSRLQYFPAAGWPFLVHTAANAARAFAAIHKHDHVVGDVNDRNLLVSESATVKFIDCDSFQIRSGAKVFSCEVGVPTHTAPELQGQSLRTAIRTANHDAFGLAVLVFQLLLMGRHPFSGIPLLAGDMPIEKAVGEYRFAYGPKAASRGMKSPPAAAPLEILPSSLTGYFERAFSNQGAIIGRPKASDWATELDALSRSLKTCDRDPAHSYYKGLGSCPWCALQSASGLVLFSAVVTFGHTPVMSAGTFVHIDEIIRWVQSVTPPGPLPNVPAPASISVNPSPSVMHASRKLRKRRRAAYAVGVTGLILVVAVWSSSASFGMAIAVFSILVARHVLKSEPDDVKALRQLASQEFNRAAVDLAVLLERWNRASQDQFVIQLNQLRQKSQDYQGLSALRDAKLKRLQETSRERQLKRYLQSHSVASSHISGIGPARIASLRAHGISTAADITPAVIHAPGIGNVMANNLLGWRKYLENRFQGLAPTGVTSSDIAELDREIAAVRSQLIKELQQGQAALKHMRVHIVSERQSIQPLLQPALHAVRQAEVDLAAL